DGSEKPAVDVFRRFRRRRDAGMIPEAAVAPALDVSADDYYLAPSRNFERLYARWLSRDTP
ncbi:MAG TPA: hypothetical protein VH638_12055, partial [Gemmatimonadaceae bacterium]